MCPNGMLKLALKLLWFIFLNGRLDSPHKAAHKDITRRVQYLQTHTHQLSFPSCKVTDQLE